MYRIHTSMYVSTNLTLWALHIWWSFLKVLRKNGPLLWKITKSIFPNLWDIHFKMTNIWHKSKLWKLEPHFTNLLLHPQLWTSHWRPRVHDLLWVFEAFQQLEGGILSGCSAFGCDEFDKIRQFSHVLSNQNGASSDAITRVTLTQPNADIYWMQTGALPMVL